MKKRVLAIVLAALIAALTFSLAGCGKKPETDSKVFIMGIDPEYPPFSYLGDDGNYTGFDVDVCKAACDYLG